MTESVYDHGVKKTDSLVVDEEEEEQQEWMKKAVS